MSKNWMPIFGIEKNLIKISVFSASILLLCSSHLVAMGEEKEEETGPGEESKDKEKNLTLNKFIKALLEKEKYDFVDNLGNTIAHLAIEGDRVDILNKVKMHNAGFLAQKNKNGLTPLHLAVRHHAHKCFQFLVEEKVDINAENIDNITPTMLAAKYGNVAALKKLIELGSGKKSGGDALFHQDSWGQTALHYAVLHLNIDAAEIILENGGDILYRDQLGMNAIFSMVTTEISKEKYASDNNYTQKVKKAKGFLKASLLKHPQTILNSKDVFGNTILHLATANKSALWLNFLLKNLSSPNFATMVNKTNKMGLSPYHILELAFTSRFLSDQARKTEWVERKNKFAAKVAQSEVEVDEKVPDLLCPSCQKSFVKPILVACGDIACRSCLQLMSNNCVVCNDKIKYVDGYSPIWYLDSVTPQASRNDKLGMESAISNLDVFGNALKKALTFDMNHTTVLLIDGDFPLHITYLDKKEEMHVYAPLCSTFAISDKLLNQLMNFGIVNVNYKKYIYSGQIGIINDKKSVMISNNIPAMGKKNNENLKNLTVAQVKLLKNIRENVSKLDAAFVDDILQQNPLLFVPVIMEGEWNEKADAISFAEGVEFDNWIQEVKWQKNNQQIISGGSVINKKAFLIKLPTFFLEQGDLRRQQITKLLEMSVFGHKTEGGRLLFTNGVDEEHCYLALFLDNDEVEPDKKAILKILKEKVRKVYSEIKNLSFFEPMDTQPN